MAEYSPQDKYYKDAARFNFWALLVFWLISVLSIADTLPYIVNSRIELIIQPVLLLLLILYITFISMDQIYLRMKGNNIRIRAFIYNSFGNKESIKPAVGYFTNDDVDHGINKCAVNLFENIFFTTQLSKLMRKKEFGKLLAIIVLFVIIIFIGINKHTYLIPVLQIVFSIEVVFKMIKLYFFVENNEKFFEEICELFSVKKQLVDTTDWTAKVLRIFGEYEANLAWGNVPIDSKIYKNENQRLSNEWVDLKKKYSI
jgi:hypothetical protein